MTLWYILSPFVGTGLTVIVFWFWKPWAEAYSGEKGRNLARKEDLEKLVTEMKALTRAQEEIKSRLSGKLWNAQKHWNQKRKVYRRLLGVACKTAAAYRKLAVDRQFHKSIHSPNPHFAAVLKMEERLLSTCKYASIFMGAESLQQYEAYITRRDIPESVTDVWANNEAAQLTKLIDGIIKTAKTDLEGLGTE